MSQWGDQPDDSRLRELQAQALAGPVHLEGGADGPPAAPVLGEWWANGRWGFHEPRRFRRRRWWRFWR